MGHVTNINARTLTDPQALQSNPAEPPHNEATPADIAIPIPGPAPVQPPGLAQLFVDDNTLAQIHGITAAKDENTKKAILPDIIPGFKASSLDIGEPTVSYSIHTISELSSQFALCGAEPS